MSRVSSPRLLFLCLSLFAWLLGGPGCAGNGEVASVNGTPAPTRAEQEAERALAQADVAAARGRLDEAEAQYRRASKTLPDDPRVWAGLVRVLIAQGELDEAIELDDRVAASGERPPRSLTPRERCDLWLAGAVARVEASRQDAGDLLDRIVAEEGCAHVATGPVRANLRALEAAAAADAGDAAGEIVALRAAVAADPSRVDLEARLGRALLDAGERHEALRALSEALARHADAPELQALMLEALGLPAADGSGA